MQVNRRKQNHPCQGSVRYRWSDGCGQM